MNEARYIKNLEVFKSLKNNNLNPELLKGYTGWGGLREAIYTPAIYREIKKFLTADEILSIKKTLTSAYYTPSEIVDFIYKRIETYGFNGNNNIEILEPAIGSGVFIERMPTKIRENSRITAVEIDQVTSKIVKALYPDVNLHTCGFEEFDKQGKYDLIIGNPPYGANKVTDKNHQDLNGYCIHHYFVAKCMRLLKRGGILAMVLPSYFLDNVSKHVRNIIAKEGGSIVEAFRLPEDLFANAKVTVDVVFLTKGDKFSGGNKDLFWTKARDIKVDGYYMPLNEYFVKNKENILGELKVVDIYERKGLTCKRTGDVFAKLCKVNCKNTEADRSVNIKAYIQNVNAKIKQLQEQINLLNEEVKRLAAV